MISRLNVKGTLTYVKNQSRRLKHQTSGMPQSNSGMAALGCQLTHKWLVIGGVILNHSIVFFWGGRPILFNFCWDVNISNLRQLFTNGYGSISIDTFLGG